MGKIDAARKITEEKQTKQQTAEILYQKKNPKNVYFTFKTKAVWLMLLTAVKGRHDGTERNVAGVKQHFQVWISYVPF